MIVHKGETPCLSDSDALLSTVASAQHFRVDDRDARERDRSLFALKDGVCMMLITTRRDNWANRVVRSWRHHHLHCTTRRFAIVLNLCGTRAHGF